MGHLAELQSLVQIRTAVQPSPVWTFCAGQYQECACPGAVRWGTGNQWHTIWLESGAKQQTVKCSVDKLPDVAPGDSTKHCQCAVQPHSSFFQLLNPGLIVADQASKAQPTVSCEILEAGRQDGHAANALWEAVMAFCSSDWAKSNSITKQGDRAMSQETMQSLMRAWVDKRFIGNYERLFDSSGWAPRGFVNYYAGLPGGKHTRMTEKLIESVHAFSSQPIIVFNFGMVTPTDWNAQRWPRLVLLHASPIPAEEGRSFNFNKLRAMLMARVRTGVQLDSDQFVAPGVDAIFQRTEDEVTQNYAMPILPVHFLDRGPADQGAYWNRYCPHDHCRWQTARWGHAHPTWTYWALPWVGRWLRRNFRDETLPELKGGSMSALRVTDIPEDEDLLNIATWEEGGTKQWCKFDVPGPSDFDSLLEMSEMDESEQPEFADIVEDGRWYPDGAAKVFYTAHHAVDPDETQGYIEKLSLLLKTHKLPPPIQYKGKFYTSGAAMKSEHPESRCII
jgi:hypothetical protein